MVRERQLVKEPEGTAVLEGGRLGEPPPCREASFILTSTFLTVTYLPAKTTWADSPTQGSPE